MSFLFLLFTSLFVAAIADGTKYWTDHSSHDPIDPKEITFDNEEIMEWHFHPYWFQNNPVDVQTAMDLHDRLLAEVAAGTFVAVFAGVTDQMVPGLNTSNIPPINTEPTGPHPSGSFEVWVPKEYYAQVMSWFVINRGTITVLHHPLSRYEIEDHTARAVQFGPPYRLDLTVLDSDLGSPPLQYPELGLGYSAVSAKNPRKLK